MMASQGVQGKYKISSTYKYIVHIGKNLRDMKNSSSCLTNFLKIPCQEIFPHDFFTVDKKRLARLVLVHFHVPEICAIKYIRNTIPGRQFTKECLNWTSHNCIKSSFTANVYFLYSNRKRKDFYDRQLIHQIISLYNKG